MNQRAANRLGCSCAVRGTHITSLHTLPYSASLRSLGAQINGAPFAAPRWFSHENHNATAKSPDDKSELWRLTPQPWQDYAFPYPTSCHSRIGDIPARRYRRCCDEGIHVYTHTLQNVHTLASSAARQHTSRSNRGCLRRTAMPSVRKIAFGRTFVRPCLLPAPSLH